MWMWGEFVGLKCPLHHSKSSHIHARQLWHSHLMWMWGSFRVYIRGNFFKCYSFELWTLKRQHLICHKVTLCPCEAALYFHFVWMWGDLVRLKCPFTTQSHLTSMQGSFAFPPCMDERWLCSVKVSPPSLKVTLHTCEAALPFPPRMDARWLCRVEVSPPPLKVTLHTCEAALPFPPRMDARWLCRGWSVPSTTQSHLAWNMKPSARNPTLNAPLQVKIISFTSHGKIPKKSHETRPIPSIRYLLRATKHIGSAPHSKELVLHPMTSLDPPLS